MNSEIINAKIEKRILVTDAPIFSGETVKIRLEIDAADAVASNHKIVLFGDDKTALAEGTFSPSESAWIADLNTATREMAAYFEDVPVDATKSIGAMVINTSTADVITRGNVLVVSTPFPENLSPCPQTYAYLTVEEFSSSVADLETEIGGKADSSDFIQLSNTVADLSSAVAGKAESSTVAALSSAVGDASLIVRRDQYGYVGNGEIKALTLTGANDEYPMLEFNDEARGGDHYLIAANGPTLPIGGEWHEIYLPNKTGTIALDTDLEDKADSSTVADLSSTVAALPYVRTIIPATALQTITFAAETRHVYGLAPYGNNAQISVTFPQPTNQIFDCIIDADCRDAESQILIVLSDTYFSLKAVGGGLTDLATLDPGEMYRIYLTQTAFVSDGKPVMLVSRKQL